MIQGSLGTPTGVLRTLAKATPLIFSGLAVAVALRAGLFNIGAEGQLLVGGIASAWAGCGLKGLPVFVHLPLALAAGAAAGAVWGLVPGILNAARGAHEVIVTIMLNYAAIHFTHYLVGHPFKDPASEALRTPQVLASARIPSLDDWPAATLSSFGVTGRSTHFSAGFFLALIAAVLVAILFRRTALGFEIRAVGSGPDAARASGISVGGTIVKTMALSGALAGLAGAVEVLGVHRRFLDAFSPGYGFDSIAVALLGGLNAGGVVLSALLFGGLNSGALQMETLTDTPRQIAGVIQAVVIAAVGVRIIVSRRPRLPEPTDPDHPAEEPARRAPFATEPEGETA
jgi:simple sugar transport system permease protein